MQPKLCHCVILAAVFGSCKNLYKVLDSSKDPLFLTRQYKPAYCHTDCHAYNDRVSVTATIMTVVYRGQSACASRQNEMK